MAKGTKRRRRSRKSANPLLRSWIFWSGLALLVAFLALLGAVLYTLGFERGFREGLEYKRSARIQPAPPAPSSSRQPDVKKEIPQPKAPPEPAPEPPAPKEPAAQPVAKKPEPPKIPPKKPIPRRGETPRLAIIIDDVAHGHQVRALRSLGIPLNLSFFPPSPDHPDTPRLARSLSHYMVHLPMEAVGFRREEPHTLRTDFSEAQMERVVARIRRLFPKARYVNNHTGSKFTADEAAVRRLVRVLDRYGFGLVDSRTTAETKIPAVMARLGRRYLHRKVFLDNEADIAYIQGQLKKAVQKAKQEGYAIAIGHPRPATIEALRRSKGILKEVRLVYIEDL